MIQVATNSVAGTRAVAGAVAAHVRPGDLLVLVGDLGAGKTAFVQGLAHALEVTAPVTSPTFTLHQRYDGRLRIHHLDVYRLSGPDEAVDLDIGALLDDEAVTVVEWGDTILAALPADFLEVRFTFAEGDDDRVVAFSAVGSQWVHRLPALVTALSDAARDASGPSEQVDAC